MALLHARSRTAPARMVDAFLSASLAVRVAGLSALQIDLAADIGRSTLPSDTLGRMDAGLTGLSRCQTLYMPRFYAGCSGRIEHPTLTPETLTSSTKIFLLLSAQGYQHHVSCFIWKQAARHVRLVSKFGVEAGEEAAASTDSQITIQLLAFVRMLPSIGSDLEPMATVSFPRLAQ
jgi:hypothetical protein